MTGILEKQNSLQMSQIFSRSRTLVIRSFCFSRILQAKPLHHVDAAPNPTLIPLNLSPGTPNHAVTAPRRSISNSQRQTPGEIAKPTISLNLKLDILQTELFQKIDRDDMLSLNLI